MRRCRPGNVTQVPPALGRFPLREVGAVRALRDWIEDHWATVGLVASISGALTFSVILAFLFNVFATRANGGV